MNFNLIHGDALSVLRTMPDESVHCCVTSPPYYGLRDYGVDGQIGLERTYVEYIDKLVTVFREVRRVLRSDGTLWLNIADSYATGAGKVGNCPGWGAQGDRWAGYRGGHEKDPKSVAIGPMTQMNRLPQPALKPKDLMMIPARVALALQDDGWWLREDIVWCKGNGMPESVKDRCTRAHEYIFHMAKSEIYFHDRDAISEPTTEVSMSRYKRNRFGGDKYQDGGPGKQTITRTMEHMRPKQDGHGRRNDGFNEREFSGDPRERRNKRSWWQINTQPVPEAHFACMPLALAQTCILAGCPVDGMVLDPFSGAGTTGMAAVKNGRRYIGIELNQDYIDISHKRVQRYYPLLISRQCGD